jgi:protein SCO1/2
MLFLLVAALSGERCEAKNRYQRTVEKYDVPDVTLINQDRQKVPLRDLLSGDKPLLLDFIYATCTTVCPVLSAGFANMQRKLGPDAGKVRFISISIDPEHDTPEIMTKYLSRYRAKPGWDFLTGSREDIEQVLKTFDTYVQNKMLHYPLILLHAPGDDDWVRIYGLTSTKDLMKEFRQLNPK